MISLTVVGILLFAFTLSSYIINWKDYKYYSKIYHQLNKDDFEYYDDLVSTYSKDGGETIFFLDNHTIKLSEDIYLHNMPWTYLDFYSLYWYIKYWSWFNKNLKVDKDKQLFIEQPAELYTKILTQNVS